MRILLSVLFSFLASCLALPVLAADPFTVASVSVDGRGSSAIEAQTRAMQSGYLTAADILFDRLTLRSERQVNPLPELTPEIVGPLIRGQSIENERRSTTRYLGDVTFAFNPSAVQRFLRQAGLTMVNSQARERLIIPVGVTAQSEFAQDVFSARHSHSLVPLKPVSEPEFAYFASNPRESALQDIARRNGVDRVMLLRPVGGGQIDVTDISLSGDGTQDYTVYGGLDDLVARLETEWKETTAVPSSAATSITATVLYDSLGDWQYLQTAINTSAQIRDARLDALSKDGALMSLTYGQFDRLRAEMRQKGVRVERDPQLGLVIRR